ncbi:MAG: VanZ family protein [Clostridiales bacterium]|nr:VanZ family protein [Clostridiales bacterium]
MGFFYTVTDEFHQPFVKGRSGQLTSLLVHNM